MRDARPNKRGHVLRIKGCPSPDWCRSKSCFVHPFNNHHIWCILLWKERWSRFLLFSIQKVPIPHSEIPFLAIILRIFLHCLCNDLNQASSSVRSGFHHDAPGIWISNCWFLLCRREAWNLGSSFYDWWLPRSDDVDKRRTLYPWWLKRRKGKAW